MSLIPSHARVIVDLTVGGGGHAEAIMELLGEAAELIGFDRDADALSRTRQRLVKYQHRVRLVHDSYAQFDKHLGSDFKGKIDFALLDLGLSSVQLEQSGRGFAHQASSDQLDLRFDVSSGEPLLEKLRHTDERELTSILRTYGEIERPHRVAGAIVAASQADELKTVGDLVKVVTPHLYREKVKQSLSQIWQALRIWVNAEIEQLEIVLPKIVDYMREGGVIAVISFHSIEDRIVKQFFVKQENPCVCPRSAPVCVCGNKPLLRRITRKAIQASKAELAQNPRSRSARLRAAEKLGTS